MSTPEQRIYSQFVRWCEANLPRGRYFIQRIETSTGTGIPDVYFCFRDYDHWTPHPFTCWFETKTLDYKVSKEQCAWAWRHYLAGGQTYVLTDDLLVLSFSDHMIGRSLKSYVKDFNPDPISLSTLLGIS